MSNSENAIWILNGVVAAWGIWHWAHVRNGNGVWGMATPAGWVWVWQFVGFLLVAPLRVNPWHLLWWFPVGIVCCLSVGRILYKAGIVRL